MAAVTRVFESQYFILGPEVRLFEEEVAARGVAAAFYSVMKSPGNPYWGDVAKVEKAGVLTGDST